MFNRMFLMSIVLVIIAQTAFAFDNNTIGLVRDYFTYKNVRRLCVISCKTNSENKALVEHLMTKEMMVAVARGEELVDLQRFLRQWHTPVGVIIDATCNNTEDILLKCSKLNLFDAMHMWLVINTETKENETKKYVYDNFRQVNLSVDADLVVAFNLGHYYQLFDVFNFGTTQGNDLEINYYGTWDRDTLGLNVLLEGYKYYNRWDFHNLTLRAVSVILDRPKVFTPSLLEDVSYTPGVSAMTKIVSQMLNVLKEYHNFRFNYTIAGRWVGSPERNSTLAVTNSLFWREQDISATCVRVFPRWLDWVDPFLPPVTILETKFYYLIPEKGVGDYENRFLTPLSPGVWLCACAACIACALVLCCAASVEQHPEPGTYATFSVLAALCQQAYEDGVQLLQDSFSSQSRRLTMLVIGVTTMLVYNYYTSSVVSWLLSAAPPTIASLDGLIRSDLELIFEDIGYTRGWLDNAGFYYYSGFVNPKEDELREKKVTNAKKTVKLMQSVEDGIELVRTGAYAYHSEPYTASQVIGKRFSERELCELGALQMMRPSPVYIMGQKQSPYKEFFSWSLMRLLERGHTTASRARIDGGVPPCSGQIPRALALGQAAPAFALLIETYCLAVIILILEIIWYRFSR